MIRADAFKILLYEESPDNIADNHFLALSEYQLFQNYPNPFNPSTIIKYTTSNVTLSASSRDRHTERSRSARDEWSRVQLKVYDVLGNEVAILVDEYKPAGTYQVEFSASNLSSGIYFYKLQAGSFVETKKMIFLK